MLHLDDARDHVHRVARLSSARPVTICAHPSSSTLPSRSSTLLRALDESCDTKNGSKDPLFWTKVAQKPSNFERMVVAVRSKVMITSDCDGTNWMRDWMGGGLKTFNPLPEQVLIPTGK